MTNAAQTAQTYADDGFACSHAKSSHISRLAGRLSELTGRPVAHDFARDVAKELRRLIRERTRETAARPPLKERLEIGDDYRAEDGEVPVEDLIASRVAASQRKASKSAAHVRTLTLPAEPVGFLVFGDPHVDNEGCDWAKLVEHIELARTTPGVLCANVGDQHDNWIGRLSGLYANSSMAAEDGWRLSEWMLKQVQWIAIVGGNHDSWAKAAGAPDPMKVLSKLCDVKCYAPDALRLTIEWKGRPDWDPFVWDLRHTFPGHSWFHPTHGPHKEAMLDGRSHMLTAGHIHTWGQLITEQRHGRVTYSMRVRGYKKNDTYAREKGLPEQQYGEACLAVVDPSKGNGPGRTSLWPDIAAGCAWLTHLRSRG